MQVASDNWVGGFYMEVYVDGWDVDKTLTMDFHTAEIEFPKHACQNVRVVGYSETTVSSAADAAPQTLRRRRCAADAAPQTLRRRRCAADAAPRAPRRVR